MTLGTLCNKSYFSFDNLFPFQGFTNRSVKVSNLEEYWPYKFKVDAATVKGNTTSDFSNISTTSQAGNLRYVDMYM